MAAHVGAHVRAPWQHLEALGLRVVERGLDQPGRDAPAFEGRGNLRMDHMHDAVDPSIVAAACPAIDPQFKAFGRGVMDDRLWRLCMG